MTKTVRLTLAAAFVACAAPAFAAGATATINAISAEGVGAEIGKATFTDSAEGLVIEVAVKGLSGERGMHVHEKGDCGPGMKDGKAAAGFAAGPHFDPAKSGKHAGPHGEGHAGDLPKLVLNGDAPVKVVAPRVKVADVAGRSLMIHEGGDTYSDDPELGGGKGRVACGVIKAAQ